MTQTAVTISRHLYTGLWVGIVILVLIVIVCLLRPPGNGVETSALDDAIASAQAPIIVVIGADLVPQFFTTDGPDDRTLRALDSCGTLGVGTDRTKLPRECGNFKGPINRYSNVTFLEFGDGSCTAGVDSLGLVYTKHTSGSLKNKRPCHVPHN